MTVRFDLNEPGIVIWEAIPMPFHLQKLEADLSNVEEQGKVCFNNEAIRDVTTGIIFASVVVGLNSINKKNLPEWVFRLTTLERYNVPIGRYETPGGLKDWWPSKLEIESHIGLSTTAPQFNRTVWFGFMFASRCEVE